MAKLLVFFFLIFQNLSTVTGYDVVVTTDVLNVRNTPGVDGKILGELKLDEIITIIESLTASTTTIEGITGYWLKIKGRKIFGYIFSAYVKPFKENVQIKWPKNLSSYETQKFLNPYEQARYNEKQILPKLAGQVTRDDNVLKITFENKKSATFKDDGSVSYSIRDLVLNRFLIIELQYYEGIGELLVDLESGIQLKIVSRYWKISPDKNRICFYTPPDEISNVFGFQIVSLKNLRVEYSNRESIFNVEWVSNRGLIWSAIGPLFSGSYNYYYSQNARFMKNKWAVIGEKYRIL